MEPLGVNKVNFVQFNIRGLIKNFYRLTDFLSLYRPDVVCLQETMLGPASTLDNKKPIEFKKYNIYRKDCVAGKWGVAILIHKDIPHSLMNIRSALEQITVKLMFKGKQISVTSLYLPNPIKFTLNELEILNNQLLRNKLILADANSHHTLWGDRRNCPKGRILVDFISYNNLVCLNKNEPTFIAHNGRPSSIDVSLASPN